MRRPHAVRAIVFALVTLVVLGPSTAGAHETQQAGELTLVVGWAEEPAYVGIMNAVEVTIVDPDGEPPNDLVVALVAEVGFGTQSVSLTLDPTQQPARFLAPIMPTRPGEYTFSLSGRIDDEQVTITSECGPATFDCVTDSADLQFPERDPSIGELAALMEREPPSPRDMDVAAPSPWPLGATVVAAVALVVALGALGLAVARPGRSGQLRRE